MVLKGQRLDVPYNSRRTYSIESELHMNTLKGKDTVNSVAERLVTMNFLSFFFNAFSVSVFILVAGCKASITSAISHTIGTLSLVIGCFSK